jgi:hypothetical protein
MLGSAPDIAGAEGSQAAEIVIRHRRLSRIPRPSGSPISDALAFHGNGTASKLQIPPSTSQLPDVVGCPGNILVLLENGNQSTKQAFEPLSYHPAILPIRLNRLHAGSSPAPLDHTSTNRV